MSLRMSVEEEKNEQKRMWRGKAAELNASLLAADIKALISQKHQHSTGEDKMDMRFLTDWFCATWDAVTCEMPSTLTQRSWYHKTC